MPRDAEPAPATRLLIRGARVNGTALPTPDLGASSAGPFALGAGERNVEIDVLSLGGADGSNAAYRLQGAEDAWTRATGRETVR